MTEGEGAVYVTHPGLISVTDTLVLPRLVGNGTHVEVDNLVSSNAYESNNVFNYPPTNTHFDEVNVYYHVDRFREDYIKTLGNISLGKVTAQVHFEEANAKFVAPATLKIGDSFDLLGDPIPGGNDFAHEDKIMYHEYMHAVSYDISAIEGGATGETGGISEGLSDYFAGSFTVRTKILDYAFPGIERDMTDPEIDHYDDYDEDTKRHDGGEFFSAILWDLRSDIGQTDTDDMVFGALYRITSSPDLEDYREAILADAFLYGNSEACSVAEAFSDRGIGDPLLTNITGPSGLGNYEQGTWTAQTPCSSGSHSYQWRYRYNGVGSWSSVVGTSQTYSRTMITTDFELKVTVTKSGQTAENTHYVDYCSSCSGGGPRVGTPHATEEVLSQATLAEKPMTFALEPNYPNPFNPSTEIRFQLAKNVKVSLVVYDLTGREIARLVEGSLPSGYHRVTWDAGNLPSGVYVYRLTAGDFIDTQHMVLMK